MEIRAPTWQLAAGKCPCCDGQGELVFSACPSCGFVVLVCAEVGTVFEISGQTRGKEMGVLAGKPDSCVKCGASRCEHFPNATAEEIKRLGFQPGSYR